MTRVHVLFHRRDAEAIRHVVQDADLLLGDVDTQDLPGTCVAPEPGADTVRALAAETAALFERLQARFGSTVGGFVNLFFEASVVPILSYAIPLGRLIESRRQAGETPEVFFPTRLLAGRGTSTFFLAEHETQGRLLYRRNQVFQPYLEALCRDLGVRVHYHGGNELSVVPVYAWLRRSLTWAMRFAFALAKTLAPARAPGAARPQACDLIAISRLPTKSEYLYPILTATGIRGHLVVAENFLNFRRNAAFSHKLYRDSKATFAPVARPGMRALLAAYARGVWRAWRFRDEIALPFGGVRLALSSAVSEMLVNYPDLLLYETALRRSLALLPRPGLKLVLSTEQKSPYAFVDASVARSLGYRCFHLMEADQSDRPLPSPVFGDAFVVETQGARDRFRASWPDVRDRVVFYGSIRGSTAASGVAGADRRESGRWCFFTSADARKDRPIIESLWTMHQRNGLDFMVKLHPRDAIVKYRRWRDLVVVPDGTVPRQDLYARFDYALAFNSAVIADLFWFDKPFVLLDIESEAYFNEKVHQVAYGELVVRRLGDVPAAMKRLRGNHEAFDRYRDQFIRESGGSVTSGLIVDRIVQAAQRAGAGVV